VPPSSPKELTKAHPWKSGWVNQSSSQSKTASSRSCAGAVQGDSGGAVYRSMAGGKVMAMGIVSAGWSANGVCYGAYAKLSGVRAWDSGVSVLTS
jgi:hypothetical protein